MSAPPLAGIGSRMREQMKQEIEQMTKDRKAKQARKANPHKEDGRKFQDALTKVGLTAYGAGKTGFFGVAARNLYKWCDGTTPVPKMAWLLVQIMLKHKLTVLDVEKLHRNEVRQREPA